MQNTNYQKRARAPVIFWSLVMLAGCVADNSQELEWEQFKAASTRVVEGREIYIVEWDLPIENLDRLREYYEATRAGPFEGMDIAQTKSGLMVNTVGGNDDVWNSDDALELTYCVSTDFAGNYARAKSEMAVAAADWARLANVDFVYDASEDSNCDNTNPDVTFAVRPWTSGGACAFFPSGGGCVPRTVVMDFVDFDTDPFWDTAAPNMTTTGVFRHELGHVLGFRHEHTNPGSGTCFEDSDWRALTPYDPSSVMHYQWCNGVLASNMTLTALDLDGSIGLYGLSAAAVNVVTSVLQ